MTMQEFSGVKYYKKAQHGYFVNGKHGRMHRAVYRDTYGNIPHGWEVHHLDGDRSNNAIENLKCMPGREHRLLHRVPGTFTCRQCGKEYTGHVSAGRGNHFCSKSCSNRYGHKTWAEKRDRLRLP